MERKLVKNMSVQGESKEHILEVRAKIFWDHMGTSLGN